MAATLIALLRGINVGKAKRVAMADLRGVLEGLGYTDVRTLLNSGNVVFRAGALPPMKVAKAIEAALVQRLGVSSRVTVITALDLAGIAAENPLLDLADNHSRMFAAVWSDPADRSRLEFLAGRTWKPEAFALGRRAAYLWCPNGALQSPLTTAVGRVLRDGATTRNWATIGKLDALASASN